MNFRSATMQLPGIYIFSAPLVGCVLMAFETVVECLGVVSGELEPFAGRPVNPEEPAADTVNLNGMVDLSDLTTDAE